MPNLIEIITREMRLRNYNQRTIEAYFRVISDLYQTVGKPPWDITADEIKDYLYKKQESGLSSQSIALFAMRVMRRNYWSLRIFGPRKFTPT